MSPDIFHSFLNSEPSTSPISEQQVEAARYAVLRRLSPALHHHMVRNLQPIGMIYGVLDHRFASPAPDLPRLHKDVDKMNGLARAALTECISVGTWLAPEADVLTPLGHGVAECVALMAANLNFRGYQMINQVNDAGQSVRRDALRSVLVAALFAATDLIPGPAVLTLSSVPDGERAQLYLDVRVSDSGESQLYDDGYRKLRWSDVQALATCEDVLLLLQNDIVTMSFPVETALPQH